MIEGNPPISDYGHKLNYLQQNGPLLSDQYPEYHIFSLLRWNKMAAIVLMTMFNIFFSIHSCILIKMSLNIVLKSQSDSKLALIQIMVYSCLAARHYLKQCWTIMISLYHFTRPQWVSMSTLVKSAFYRLKLHIYILFSIISLYDISYLYSIYHQGNLCSSSIIQSPLTRSLFSLYDFPCMCLIFLVSLPLSFLDNLLAL